MYKVYRTYADECVIHRLISQEINNGSNKWKKIMFVHINFILLSRKEAKKLKYNKIMPCIPYIYKIFFYTHG